MQLNLESRRWQPRFLAPEPSWFTGTEDLMKKSTVASPTIRDIASAAGVSKTTVGRVLNKSPDVNEATRERVLQIAQQLAYVPDERARALVRKETRTLGVVLAGLTHPSLGGLIRAIVEAAHEHGYTILLSDTNDDLDAEREALDLLRGKRVDGILLRPQGVDHSAITRIRDAGIPVVLMGRYFDDLDIDSVRHDHHRIASLAAEHLLALGHRRIVYFSGRSDLLTARDRLQGFRQALETHNVDSRAVKVIPVSVEASDGWDATRRLLAGKRDWSAIIAYTDMAAIGVLRGLIDAGLKVPEDVSVIGCDDTGIGEYLPVRLTTIAESWPEMGRSAIKLLMRRIHQGPTAKPRTIILPPQVHVRESTGPAPGIALPETHSEVENRTVPVSSSS